MVHAGVHELSMASEMIRLTVVAVVGLADTL